MAKKPAQTDREPLAAKGKKYREKAALVTKDSYPWAEATELLSQVSTTKFEATAGAQFRRVLGAFSGFELETRAWRPTLKLSQNAPSEERERIAAGLEANGSPAIARLMRTLAR